MLRNGYVLFDETIEKILPEEEDIANRIIASGQRACRRVFEKDGIAVRAAHAKGHGILKGELTVDANLPEHLRQGVFADPRTYPVIVRYSTAFGDIRSDRIKSARGMAIKVLGVRGEKALPEDTSATQDLLLVNHPVYFADAASYEKITAILEHLPVMPDIFLAGAEAAASGLEAVLTRTGLHTPIFVSAAADAGNNILGETFHSMAAIRFGDYIAKISASPAPGSAISRVTGTAIGSEDDALRELVTAFFTANEAEYELRAQLCTNLDQMPIEDASIKSSEELSPHQLLGRLVLPAGQRPNSPERQRFGDDTLSFTPWHCLAAHRPLGSIMRLRKKVYDASNAGSHQRTQQPRTEPLDLGEVPD
jgi:catalase